jgi:hypothetical protein
MHSFLLLISNESMSDVSFDNPFYDEMAKYPARFAAPVLFGDPPASSYSASLRNGTATLLTLKDRFLAVTCQHLLDSYRKAQATTNTFFQLAHVAMNPNDFLVDEDRDLDLAVLDLTSFVGKAPYLTEANFISPILWPPQPVTTNDVLCLAGFPGIWRDQVELGHVRFYSYSSGASEVTSVNENKIVTRVNIQDCVTQINHGKVFGFLGGLSGGPVFAWRKTPVLVAELVGFIYEYQESLDLMFVRSAAVIREDGRLAL